MHNLTPFAYLNVKFVCRRLYLAGKNFDGSDLVVHKYRAPYAAYAAHFTPTVYPYMTFRQMKATYKSIHRKKRAVFGSVMARVEASLSTSIERKRLTCSECGKVASIALKRGFSDEEFQQANGFRKCLQCQCSTKSDETEQLTAFHIRRKAFHRCCGCKAIKPELLAVREEHVQSHFAGSEEPMGRILERFRRMSAGNERICAGCYRRVLEEVLDSGNGEVQKKTNFGVFGKR